MNDQREQGLATADVMPPSDGDGNNKRLLVIVLLVAVVGVLAWMFLVPRDTGRPEETRTQISENTIRTDVPGDAIIGSMPEELLPEEEITINDSYQLAYTDRNINVRVLEYTSTLSLEDNINFFETRLAESDWENIDFNEPDPQAGISEIRATRFGIQQATITFTDQDDAVDVVISYQVGGGGAN